MSKKHKAKEEEDKVEANLLKLEGLDDYCPFPVFIATGEGNYIDTEKLDGPVSYVITGNGLMIYRDSGVFEVVTNSEGIAGLAEVKRNLSFRLKPFPDEEVKKVAAFFKWASKERHGAEAIVLPYYNKETQEWLIVVPDQKATGGHVEYTPPNPSDIPEGYSRIGTWHSHGTMSAFHSSVDVHDEEKDDGLHITFGHVESPGISVVSTVAMYGVRWSIDPAHLFKVKSTTTEVPVTTVWQGNTKTFKGGNTETRLEIGKDSVTFPDAWKKLHHEEKIINRATIYHGNNYSNYTPPKEKCSCFDCLSYCSSYDLGTVSLVFKTLSESDSEKSKDIVDRLKAIRFIGTKKVTLTEEGFNELYKLQREIAALLEDAGVRRGNLTVTLAFREMVQVVRLAQHANYRKEFLQLLKSKEDLSENARHNLNHCMNPNGHYHDKVTVSTVPTSASALDCKVFEPTAGYVWTYEAVSARIGELSEKRHRLLHEQEEELAEMLGVACDDCERFWAMFCSSHSKSECCEQWWDKLNNGQNLTHNDILTEAGESPICDRFESTDDGTDVPFDLGE